MLDKYSRAYGLEVDLDNTLPTTIRTAASLASFKIVMKTYLFKAAFL